MKTTVLTSLITLILLISTSGAQASPIFVPRDVPAGASMVTGLPFTTTSPPALVNVTGLLIPPPPVDAIFDHGVQHLYVDSTLNTFLWQVTLQEGSLSAMTTLVNLDLGQIPPGGTTVNQGFTGSQLVSDFMSEHGDQTGIIRSFTSVRVIDFYEAAVPEPDIVVMLIVGTALMTISAVRKRQGVL